MLSLVGKYLLVTGSGSVLKNGNWIANYGHWSLMQSPSGDGADWSMIASGMIDEPMATLDLAQGAADSFGLTVARDLQNDQTLQPIAWMAPFPKVPG